MKLYMVMFDGEQYWIEAKSFSDAIVIWKSHVKDLWGSDYDGTEEPESLSLMNDEPVIRGEGRA